MYRDKHTLVEVTVHRNPKAGVGKQDSKKSYYESLSDSETVFRKPRSPKKNSSVKRDKHRGAAAVNKEN